ncbi:MAG: RNA polymerase sigma factor [Phocaeicola sp.]
MEEALLNGLIAGSYKSYTTLYDKWVSPLYRFVYSLVKSEEIAKDIVQETFIKIWTNRRNINVNLSFKSYLFTISYHLVLKELKRRINHPQMENYMEYCNELQVADSMTDTQCSFDTFLAELEKAKTKLSPRQHQIFEMNKEYNLSISEIAQELSLTEQSVRNQLSTSLKIIRKELNNHPYIFLLLFL